MLPDAVIIFTHLFSEEILAKHKKINTASSQVGKRAS